MVLQNYKTTHSFSVIQRRNSLSGEVHPKIFSRFVNSPQMFVMKHFYRIFALTLALSNITAQDTRPSVAVLDLKPGDYRIYEAERLQND